MRYLVLNIPLWLDEDEEVLTRRAAERLGLGREHLREVLVVRRSLDARKRGHPRWLVNLEVEVSGEVKAAGEEVREVPAAEPPPEAARVPDQLPVIVGAGPAGLFCAHALLERGIRSLVLDRGQPVEPRRRDVAALMRDGTLDPESNMNFGEGGAGAYTDGKLGTRIHHPAVRKVVELFARFGGVERILTEGKPHVGSDLLPGAISALRHELERGGCTFRFGARVTDLAVSDGALRGAVLQDGTMVPASILVLAPGNSARELYELFERRRFPLAAKPFAVGFRAEHPQPLIDRIQYGMERRHPKLPPADYKLADNPKVAGEARGVFSFCMCPGGVVVPTPTEPGMQCTNGMSNSHRSSPLANAGMVVSVAEGDFAREGFQGPLAGLQWQRKWERAAFELGGGGYRAPAQRLSAYLAGKKAESLARSSYHPGLTPADLHALYPQSVQEALVAGLRSFGRKMRGFVTDEALLIGVETRTSAPCRLLRGEDLESPGIRGLYPAGEGAGYAGGIVSSAVDGLKVAEAIAQRLGPR